MISIDELRIKLPNISKMADLTHLDIVDILEDVDKRMGNDPNFEKMVKLGEFVNKLEKGEI